MNFDMVPDYDEVESRLSSQKRGYRSGRQSEEISKRALQKSGILSMGGNGSQSVINNLFSDMEKKKNRAHAQTIKKDSQKKSLLKVQFNQNKVVPMLE